MRKKYIILIGGISLLFLTGCVSSKKMTYMYKGEKVLTGNQTSFLYDARIMPKDLLTITVSYSEPELAAPFNMGGSIANPLGGSTATSLSATSSSQPINFFSKARKNFSISRTNHACKSSTDLSPSVRIRFWQRGHYFQLFFSTSSPPMCTYS